MRVNLADVFARRVGPMQRAYFIPLVLVLAAWATASTPTAFRKPDPPPTPYARAATFTLEAPSPATLGRKLELWATHYHTPVVEPALKTISASFPLIGAKNQPISERLTWRDWCAAALQGSVAIRSSDGKQTAFVYVDSRGPEQVNCDDQLGSLSDGIKRATRRARFMAVAHPQGCGVRRIPLTPYRTVAVDPALIPIGTVLFIPELRGLMFNRDGELVAHDGYLFAGDQGGAVNGAHVDVFTDGADPMPMEDLFASTSARTFAAQIVDPKSEVARAVSDSQSAPCLDAEALPVDVPPGPSPLQACDRDGVRVVLPTPTCERASGG